MNRASNSCNVRETIAMHPAPNGFNVYLRICGVIIFLHHLIEFRMKKNVEQKARRNSRRTLETRFRVHYRIA